MTEKQYTLEWESEEICQVAYDGNYIGTDEVVDRLNGLTAKNKVLYKEIERLKRQNEDILYNNAKNMELLEKENEQLKQQLFETSKELLWATSDEVDRALHYEDEVEELRKEIFE